eukprot:365521-Chlamydomonas_euryale.AAC.5
MVCTSERRLSAAAQPNRSLAHHELKGQPLPRSLARVTLGFVEVWGEGADWQELSDAVAAYPSALKEPWLRASIPYKV